MTGHYFNDTSLEINISGSNRQFHHPFTHALLGKVALGVLEVHANHQFTNEELKKGVAYNQLSSLIRYRLLYQTRYLIDELGEEGAFLLMSAPDCGLRPVNRLEDLHIMLSSLVEGTKQARSVLTDEYDFLPS